MRIFISYGRQDAAEFAARLAEWLRVQGFKPWLDVENGIPIGAPFDVQIEIGISGSDMLVALLSPWGLRPEGFCRNEILFAHAKKKPIIPVRIADVDLPIQIFSLNYIDAAGDPDLVFARLLPVIRQVQERGRVEWREWPSSTPGGPWWADRARPAFEEELARYGGTFVGRQWLFEQIREWVHRPGSRLLLLTADAGVGKSAIAAQMTAQLNVRGVHFCSRSNTESCHVAAWVGDLCYQLAAQFPPYREQIERMPPPDWSQPESAFRVVVADPLRACQDRLKVAEPWVFVVDGLDESVAVAGPELASLLADSSERFPSWLRLIATCRPDLSLLAMFHLDGVRHRHLDAEGEQNAADLRAYVESQTAALPEALLPHGDKAVLVEKILAAAAGNFLFARMTLEALTDPDRSCRLNADEVGAFPGRLGGLYHAMFRKRFPDRGRYEREVLPLLDCLVAARGPIPKPLLLAAGGLGADTADRGLLALSQFLNRTEKGVTLFHRSAADWLTDVQASGHFVARRPLGQERLANACLLEFNANPHRVSPYTTSHLAWHLAEAGRMEELRRLLLDFRWLEAKLKAGDVAALVADYDLACGEDDAVRDTRSGLRLAAHVLTRDMRQLASQLWGRLLGHPRAEVRALLDQAARLTPASWLRPTVRCLTGPGGPLVQTLEGHEGAVNAVVLNANGDLALSGSSDQTLRLWDLATGRVVRCLEGHGGAVFALALADNGRTALSGSYDQTLKVWDLSTGHAVLTLEGHAGEVSAVAMTGDGRLAVSGSADRTLKVWDLACGRLVWTLEGHADRIAAVAVTADGRLAVSASWDGTLRVWDLVTGREAQAFHGHTEMVTAVVLTHHGRQAVSGSLDGTIRVWDPSTGKAVRALAENANPVTALAATVDGRRVVSGSLDKTMRVWDTLTAGALQTVEGHAEGINAVAVAAEGRLAVSASDDRTLKVWDLSVNQAMPAFEGHAGWVMALAVARDGRRVVSASDDKTLRVWDPDTGQALRTVRAHLGGVMAVALTGAGGLAVSGSSDQTLQVWDLETGQVVRSLRGHSGCVKAVAVTRDDRWVVSGSDDKTLRIWDLETGKELRVCRGHSGWVMALALAADSRLAISGSFDKTLKVWDLARGEIVRTLEGHTGWVRTVAVTPDGRLAVSGSSDNTLKVWDLSAGQAVQTLKGHTGGVMAVAVTGDGRLAVSGASDRSLRVWDLRAGTTVATFIADGPVTACGVLPDNRTVVAGDATGQVHFLQLV